MDKDFVNGIRIYKPREGAPDFIKLNILVNLKEFNEWAKQRVDSDGLIRIDLKKSKEGRLYLERNTWVKNDVQVQDNPDI